jgi:hypothetical protein
MDDDLLSVVETERKIFDDETFQRALVDFDFKGSTTHNKEIFDFVTGHLLDALDETLASGQLDAESETVSEKQIPAMRKRQRMYLWKGPSLSSYSFEEEEDDEDFDQCIVEESPAKKSFRKKGCK